MQARKTQFGKDRAAKEEEREEKSSKMRLEKQNKEIKMKLKEVENFNRAKAKAAIAALESKVNNLEEQLSAEALKEGLPLIRDLSRQERPNGPKEGSPRTSPGGSLSRPLQVSPDPSPGLYRVPDTDPYGSFDLIEAANTARGSTMLQ